MAESTRIDVDEVSEITPRPELLEVSPHLSDEEVWLSTVHKVIRSRMGYTIGRQAINDADAVLEAFKERFRKDETNDA